MTNKKRGFTLAEMIIAVAILSVASMYVVQMLVVTKNLRTRSYEIDRSVRISKNIIELISSGESVTNSKDDLLLKMKAENGIYILNFDEDFNISNENNALYKLFMTMDTKDGLDNVNMSMPTLIIFGVWTSLAFNIIILLAGLRNIDSEHFKIAKMFGATDREIFWRITFPQLVPTIAFLSTVNLIGAFKVYTQVYALFGGSAGTANSATTAVYYIYDKFHVAGRPGVAMAATVILFAIILFATFLQNKFLRKAEG